eukprot:COSAG02_NODE_2949_length_7680_cov_4.274238_4_plen_52_part_00
MNGLDTKGAELQVRLDASCEEHVAGVVCRRGAGAESGVKKMKSFEKRSGQK